MTYQEQYCYYPVIRANGRLDVVKLTDTEGYYGAIGCDCFQGVTADFLDDYVYLVIDDEGKLVGKPVNVIASLLYNHMPNDCIVGDAVICRVDRFVVEDDWIGFESFDEAKAFGGAVINYALSYVNGFRL